MFVLVLYGSVFRGRPAFCEKKKLNGPNDNIQKVKKESCDSGGQCGVTCASFQLLDSHRSRHHWRRSLLLRLKMAGWLQTTWWKYSSDRLRSIKHRNHLIRENLYIAELLCCLATSLKCVMWLMSAHVNIRLFMLYCVSILVLDPAGYNEASTRRYESPACLV